MHQGHCEPAHQEGTQRLSAASCKPEALPPPQALCLPTKVLHLYHPRRIAVSPLSYYVQCTEASEGAGSLRCGG